LEDQQKDSLFPEPLALSVSHGGGGAASLVSLAILGIAGLYRRRRAHQARAERRLKIR